MAEMKTLNGYEVVDAKARAEIEKAKPLDMVKDYSAQQHVQGTRLIGRGKGGAGGAVLKQRKDADSTIEVMYNWGSVEHVRLKKEFETKDGEHDSYTAIDVRYVPSDEATEENPVLSSQMLNFNDVFIVHDLANPQNDYDIGVKLPGGYYSQFNSCWIQAKTGIKIGREDGKGWIGVLDFNACHFNSCVEAFKIFAKDTNTICLDKCSFEGSDLSIDNTGTLYVRNTYFGDQLKTGNKHAILLARPGSKTYFSDSTIGLGFYADGGRESIFDLVSDNGNGDAAKVFVMGGLLYMSNNTLHKTSQSAIYSSDSEKNEIYLDFVSFVPSTNNHLHNWIPYYIYDGFSPLRSKFPIKNYVCNGTMKSELGNAMLLSHSTSTSGGNQFYTAMTNPFGGEVLRGFGKARFFYKIPKSMVGKPMTLELYLFTGADTPTNPAYNYDTPGFTPSGLTVNSPTLGVDNWQKAWHAYEDMRRPMIYRIDVTPTAETGYIDFDHNKEYYVYGVILKEHKYKDFLSCYEDSGELYSDETPSTDSAIEGDTVGCVSNPGKVWSFSDGRWLKTAEPSDYSIEFSDGKLLITFNNGASYFFSGTPWTHKVTDLVTCSRCRWDINITNGTFNPNAGNQYVALACSTPNNFPKTDRYDNTVYPIPIPAKASKVTVSHDDGIKYRYEYVFIKVLDDGNTSIAKYCDSSVDPDKCELPYYEFTEGEYDYVLISCDPIDDIELPWNMPVSASVEFSRVENEEV